MTTMTLLDMTQDILSDMDSDDVNSISDTVESLQVAQIIKTTYFNIIDGKDWPQLYRMFQLEASGDVARPTYMKLPDDVIDVNYIKYNVRRVGDAFDRLTEIKYKDPHEFMRLVDARHSDSTNVLATVDPTGVKINIMIDTPPTFYTCFDNVHVVFDAYDNAVDNTLQESKTQAYGKVYPTWTMVDTFIPAMPISAFSYLLNEAKATAFIVAKQAPNPKAEQNSITQRRRMSQEAWRVVNGVTLPNYGRNGKNYSKQVRARK